MSFEDLPVITQIFSPFYRSLHQGQLFTPPANPLFLYVYLCSDALTPCGDTIQADLVCCHLICQTRSNTSETFLRVP